MSLLNASSTSTADATDFGTLTYGMLSKNGVPYYVYSDGGERTFSTTNGTLYFQFGIQDYSNVIPTSSSQISPVISLPQSPLINGLDFYSDQTLTTSTPTISWNPPATGTANYYLVSVVGITPGGGDQSYSFYTTTKSVLFPPGLLQSGQTYVVSITAASDTAVTLASAPFRQGTTPAYGTIVSGAMTVSSSSSKAKHAQPNSAKQNVYVTLVNGRVHIDRK
jgi:hypothetical protein